MSRFLKKSAYKGMRCSKMQNVDCGRSNQLSVSEIVIADPAKKALALLKPDHQKSVMLGIRAFNSISVHYLQSCLSLQNLNKKQCQGH